MHHQSSNLPIIHSFRSLQILHDYAKVYEPYLAFLRLDIPEYVREVEEKFGNIENLQMEQIKHLIVQNQRNILEIEFTIPESINLGLFSVGGAKVSRALIAKHQKLVDLLLELLTRKCVEYANLVAEKYTAIQHRLNKMPNNIEELTELREYMGTIPTQLGDLKTSMNQTLANFNVIDSIGHKLDRGNFNLKWEVFGWPKDITVRMAEVDDELTKRKREYQMTMEEEQEGFVERLKGLRSVRKAP